MGAVARGLHAPTAPIARPIRRAAAGWLQPAAAPARRRLQPTAAPARRRLQPTAPPPGQYGGGYPPSGYGAPAQPGYGGYPSGYYPPAAKRTDGTAITALVLSIASFVVCPIIPAIVALVMVPSARRNIESSGGTLEGLGLLTAAKIVSWINIGLWVLLIIGWVVAVIIIGTSTSSTNNNAMLFGL